MVDRFAEQKGYLPLMINHLADGDFQIIPDSEFNLGITKKRHGGILKLKEEEYERLEKAYR